MSVTVFLDPTQLPAQGQQQSAFDANVASFFSNLSTFGNQVNATAAAFNSAAAGNAYAIPYTIDLSGTSDIDPGNGNLRFDNATQNLATTLRLDLLGTNSVDYTAMLDTFDASTSTVKGHIRIVKLGDASKFLLFSVSARTAPTGYRDISVTPVASSSANPFVAGDGVLLFFQRTGDKGNPGNTGFAKFADQKPSGTGGGDSLQASTSWNVRTLNTTVANTFGATLSGNNFTLPAGTYVIQARAPAWAAGAHRAQIRNNTDGNFLDVGSSALAGSGSGVQTDSVVCAYVVLTSPKSFSIWHATAAASVGGLGSAVSAFSTLEVYTEVSVWKLS